MNEAGISRLVQIYKHFTIEEKERIQLLGSFLPGKDTPRGLEYPFHMNTGEPLLINFSSFDSEIRAKAFE